jgi:hypothetical protein
MFMELVPYLEKLADVICPAINVPMSERIFPFVKNGTMNLRTSIERMINWPGCNNGLSGSKT